MTSIAPCDVHTIRATLGQEKGWQECLQVIDLHCHCKAMHGIACLGALGALKQAETFCEDR